MDYFYLFSCVFIALNSEGHHNVQHKIHRRMKWATFCVCIYSDVCLVLFQFSVFLGLIFFLELTAGILAFVFKDWIKDQLNFFINNNVKAYRDDIDLQNLIDFAQEYVSPH